MSELDFIQTIRHRQKALSPGCLGIGDDAAIIEPGAGGWVIATDMLVEGRHFDSELHLLRDIGRKALAVNLSDMAAMGAIPRYSLVSLAIPDGFGLQRIGDLWEGLQELADQFHVTVIGGDTNSWPDGLVINVCVLGQPHSQGSILRSGAKAGDEIFVTGALGGSLEDDHHLRFCPRVQESQEILNVIRPTAMIDISDGLATDLGHICTSSGVGADLDSNLIPISPRIPASVQGTTRLQRALTDGEDFELLFTAPPGKTHFLESLPFKCYRIGKIGGAAGVRLDNSPLEARGFEHKF